MTSVDYLDNSAKIASYLGAFGSLALTALDPTATTKTLTDTTRTLDEVVTGKNYRRIGCNVIIMWRR